MKAGTSLLSSLCYRALDLFLHEEPRWESSFAFDRNPASRLEFEIVLQELIHGFRHLDAVRTSGALHAAGDIDGIAPYVIAEFLLADDAGDDAATMKSDADVDRVPIGIVHMFDCLQEVQRKVSHVARGETPSRSVRAGDGHVLVADRFDFLHAIAVAEVVKQHAHLAQDGDDALRRKAAR